MEQILDDPPAVVVHVVTSGGGKGMREEASWKVMRRSEPPALTQMM
jgi:hypothetical protein